MTRTAILVAALLLLPIAAVAQAGPANRTITVNGSAESRVPATLARVTMGLSSTDHQPVFTAQNIRPIIDALIKAGADPSSVHVPLGLTSSGAWSAASISAAFSQPTAASVQGGIKSAATIVASMKDVTLTGVWLDLTASDCSAVLEGLRHDAVSQAHAKALSLASDLKVQLGAALTVASFDQNAADGSCSTEYAVGQYSGEGPKGPIAPTDYATVPVQSHLSVTYTIK